jgi:integrase/recombinase XerD
MVLLREKMRNDLRVRGLSALTEEHYIRHWTRFVRFFGISPKKLNLKHVHKYQSHLVKRGLAAGSINISMAAIRFFFMVTLKRNWRQDAVPWMRKKRKVPVILSPIEVEGLLNSVKNMKHRAVLTVIYAAGLRINEVVHLTAGDIDSQRMLIHVKYGKGAKERYTILSPTLLHLLRNYWKSSREDKSNWLFPGEDPKKPFTIGSVQHMMRKAVGRLGIQKKVSAHTLRHCFATHLLENGVDIRRIQHLLGHSSIASTTIYTRVTDATSQAVKSPLDSISVNITR